MKCQTEFARISPAEINCSVSIPRVKLQIKVNQQTKKKESILLIKKTKEKKQNGLGRIFVGNIA